ncbi:MAG: hypothetical protein COA32_06465 [Fluviicola sp.]|nr:MAG: hypothetical protein COA32_06465 [Fluviicola sp.]
MKDSKRYGCWLIDNIKFSGVNFSKTVDFDGNKIKLLITNYENSKCLEEPFQDWIHKKIVNDGMMNSRNNPLPIKSIFVITTSGYENNSSSDFTLLFNLCLKLVYYQPTLISYTSELIPNAAITMPTWEGFKNISTVSEKEINPDTFEKVLLYFNILNSLNVKHHNVLQEIYKISGINDVLIELLSLYSFIEGFWWNGKGKSNITDSFIAMLKHDYAPGKENKAKRELIKQKIETQNGLLRNQKLDDMRHILAHGMYKQEEHLWDKEQWEAIYNQRNLLIEVVIESLMKKIKNVA